MSFRYAPAGCESKRNVYVRTYGAVCTYVFFNMYVRTGHSRFGKFIEISKNGRTYGKERTYIRDRTDVRTAPDGRTYGSDRTYVRWLSALRSSRGQAERQAQATHRRAQARASSRIHRDVGTRRRGSGRSRARLVHAALRIERGVRSRSDRAVHAVQREARR